MSETLRNDEHRERAHEDPFSVPVKRTSVGHIDYAHYLSEGRRLRSSAWTHAAVAVCSGFRAMIRWAASKPVQTAGGGTQGCGLSHARPGAASCCTIAVRRTGVLVMLRGWTHT